MGELSTLDRTGDTRMQWDPANAAQVEEAHRKFNELTGRGYKAFKLNKAGNQGEQMDAFDPMEERVIMVPRMVGG